MREFLVFGFWFLSFPGKALKISISKSGLDLTFKTAKAQMKDARGAPETEN